VWTREGDCEEWVGLEVLRGEEGDGDGGGMEMETVGRGLLEWL
jgi:hypothetical protein